MNVLATFAAWMKPLWVILIVSVLIGPAFTAEPKAGNEQNEDLKAAKNSQSPADPSWPTFADNTTYLSDLHLMHQELSRFAKDPRWKDVLPQVLATQY